MTEDMPTYKRWREDVEKWMRQGEALEAIAAQHPDMSFVVHPIANTLEWYEFEEDIHAFSARVRRVAAIFGAPTTVRPVSTSGTKDLAPDIIAKWTDGAVNIDLKAFWPKCRIHPEAEYVPDQHIDGIRPKMHPECADVLKELEDYELETASLVGAKR